MKNIFKFITILMVLFSCSSWAEISSTTVSSAGWEKLNASQQAEIISKITTAVDQNTKQEATAATQLADPNKLDEWVTLGQHIGLAFGGAAKEIGVAANDFIQTPVGTMTIVLIIWHFIGNVFIHLVGGIFVFVVGMGLIYWHSRTHRYTTEEYSPDKTDILGRSRLISRVKHEMDKDWATAYYIMGFITILISVATIFSFNG